MPRWPSWFLLGWWFLNVGIIRLPSTGAGGGNAIQEGSLTRTVLVLTFGGLGAMFLPEGIRRLSRVGVNLMLVLTSYLGWSLLSLTWSDAPALTVRRLILTGMLVLGAVGLGAGYYGRSDVGKAVLARDAAIAGALAGLSVWLAAVISGSVDLMNPRWALVPIGRREIIGYAVLFTALAAVYGRHTTNIANPFASRRALMSVTLGALVTVVSLRKRVLLAVAALATGSLSLAFRRRGKRGVFLIRLGVASAVIMVTALLVGVDLGGAATQVYTRGETELDLESLTGRVPLWEELLTYVGERPWTGVGFGAFWTPERTHDVQKAVGWPAPVAHSGYLDEALATGVPGLALLTVFFVGAAIIVGLRGMRQRDSFSVLASVWIVSYLFLNTTSSLMQDFFNYPFYSSLVISFAALTMGPLRHATSVPPVT